MEYLPTEVILEINKYIKHDTLMLRKISKKFYVLLCDPVHIRHINSVDIFDWALEYGLIGFYRNSGFYERYICHLNQLPIGYPIDSDEDQECIIGFMIGTINGNISILNYISQKYLQYPDINDQVYLPFHITKLITLLALEYEQIIIVRWLKHH